MSSSSDPQPSVLASAPTNVPFELSHQLCYDLIIVRDKGCAPKLATAKHCTTQYLPGQPYVSLDHDETVPYLENELATPRLNQMAPHLWLLATPRSSHVSALHQQIVRGRNIIVTENPELHLLWVGGRVFIKPLQLYLLSHAFWEQFLVPIASDSRTQALASAAIGFVRTYRWLIRHESDFRIAMEAGLVPMTITWPSFVKFIKDFSEVSNSHVSPRYHYGELRLGRLNFWAKFFLGQWQFHKVAWQYSDYFARFYGPLLFIFAILSVVLAAMQVGAQVRPAWDTFYSVAAWFSVMTLVMIALVLAWILLMLLVMSARETLFALRYQLRGALRSRGTAKLAAAQATHASADSKT